MLILGPACLCISTVHPHCIEDQLSVHRHGLTVLRACGVLYVLTCL